MDDLDPELNEDSELDGDFDDGIIGKKKPKKDLGDDESLNDLEEEEFDALPEDSFDDVEPEDLW